MTNYYKHPTSVIDKNVVIGDNTKIWHFCHITSGAQIGENCTIGQNVFIGGKAKIGKNVKIQNNVSIFDSVEIEDDVFCGPSCVFTNVINPRAFINRKSEFLKTIVRKGATIGANSTVICGNEIGKFSFIGAGSVVTKNIRPHSLVYGNPAIFRGWVSHSGEILNSNLEAIKEKKKYKIVDGKLILIK
ncbi:MAG: N-acetyltransferase [Legionellales bacterium]|nr:N-acetyltransferase [Legionellales bacterium]|tara:strand:- start:6 stop:569 length:564 start_codon:yes stop_codon:yes gene_type:complete